MRAALALLRLLPAKRRLAVLGQMGELGDFAAEEHRALAGPVREAADLVFACGPQMRHLVDALPAGLVAAYTETSAELAPLVAAAVRDGDAVLVKGSKATLMGRVLDALPPGLVAAHTETSAELAPLVAAAVRDGDAVLVKGSKATLMGRVLDALRSGGGAA